MDDQEALARVTKKWAPLLKGIETPNEAFRRSITAAMLENQAKHLERLQNSTVGAFEKFAFPLIRRAYPSLIGGQEEKKVPLQELAERALAEHDPTDEDWGDWVAEIEEAYKLACQVEGGPPEELQKEWDRIQRIEHPEAFGRRRGGFGISGHDIISVQPMTQPIGGRAFYRPRYATSKADEKDEDGEDGSPDSPAVS